MTSSCEAVRELLSALLDGELDERRRKAVCAHLLVCPDCSREAGRIAGAKGLVQREARPQEAPAGFRARLGERLDRIDGVRECVRRSAPARRLTAIAALGAIAVSLALILSTAYLMNADRALELAKFHQQLAGIVGSVPGPGGFAAVSCSPGSDRWVETHSALLRIDGAVVSYTIYRVGDCPVSVFEGPGSWNPYRTGWLVSERVGDFDVRQVGDHCMTSWRQAGHRYVVVASTSQDAMAEIAGVYRTSLGRSQGL